jgi:predicted nucleic acid-binding protein
MPKRLLVDSDVLIDYLRGLPKAVAWLEGRQEALLVSAVTVGELYAGVRDGKERAALDAFVSAFEVVPLDQAIAEKGGLMRRDYGQRHGTGLADAFIAATAELQDATIVTLNRKHFQMLNRILVPYEKKPSKR